MNIEEEAEPEYDYEAIAWGFMQRSPEANSPTIDLKVRSQFIHCPLCVRDDTVPEEKKNIRHEQRLLRKHINEAYHDEFQKFKRRMDIAADSGDGYYYCPFCQEVAASEKQRYWAYWTALRDHINESNRKQIQGTGEWKLDPQCVEPHDTLKEEAGFYKANFDGDPGAISQRQARDRRQLAREIGLESHTTIRPLRQAIPHPTRNLQFGGGVQRRSLSEISLSETYSMEVEPLGNRNLSFEQPEAVEASEQEMGFFASQVPDDEA